MPLFGNIIVIKRNGSDGISFPLTASSCLFGRRTECDIRIQLPQVSKEHCKIEVNENKEAILTNLSTVNPTQLNGGFFQQPVPLKHGDVLTIIDRSFRFEYPPQSTPRKSRSRSPKDETLQVLHVQQVAEGELLHKQTSGSKSLPASDNLEHEDKNASENKPSTEEKVSTTLPFFKLETPKSSHRMHQSRKKQTEMSPFSKLYEKLKHEVQVNKPLQVGNASQQAAKEDGKTFLLLPATRISSSSCIYDLGSLSKGKEIGRSEEIEECKIKIKKEVISLEFHQISAVGSATKKGFAGSPPTSISKAMPKDTGNRSHLQDYKKLSTAGKSEGADVTTPRLERVGNARFPGPQCMIERLGYVGKVSSAVPMDNIVQTSPPTSISEVETDVLSTPTSRRKTPHSQFISSTREPDGTNPVLPDTPNRRRVSLKRKSLSEMLAKTHRADVVSGNDTLKQPPLAENGCLSQQRTPRKHVKEVVLEEVCDQAKFANWKEGRSEAPVSNTKSPRRNNRQSKELPNKSVWSETLAPEESTPAQSSPASQKAASGRKRARPRTSGLLAETALETGAIGEHHDKTPDGKVSGTKGELTTKGSHQKQDLEDDSAARPRRLSKRRSSGSSSALEDCEAGSEMTVSSPFAGEESGKTTKLSQKRKSGDSSLQPLGKRKRVSFGGHLSPELFDKSLPPNSPLKRGATPARLSLPFGNSPRAVLKKAPGLKHFATQELSEHLQKEKISPKNGPARKSPVASSPASGRASPVFTVGSPAPYTKGRFSVSRITAPLPIAEEDDALAEEVNTKEKSDARVKTPESSQLNQDGETFLNASPEKPTQSAQPTLKVAPRKRRSGAVAVINAKRRSGASSANLLVAKSWADVVKSGAVRPQAATVKKSVRKGRSRKKTTQSPKPPERKFKGHVSTGHAESPATIVVGRAYSTRVKTLGQVPKVVKNPILMLNMKMDESFTGMTEMFQTPENKSGETLPLAASQQMDCTPTSTAEDTSELRTPEETGEMMVSPLNSSDASEQKQDSPGFCHFLRKESLKSVFDAVSTKTPGKKKAMLEEDTSVDSWSVISEKQASRLKSGRKRTPKQKLEPLEVVSGIEQLFRTPKQRSEPAEALSGIKQLMKTPKQKTEPVEVLSGIKQLLRTPKQKEEPVEDLSGIKQLMRTPKEKMEPAEVLSGLKQLMKTPKQKEELVEALSGIQQLLRTPKQRREPVEVLSGIKQLLRTPKEKMEPAEVLSGIKQLMKTPKQKTEPVEALSGIKQLLRTPKEKMEPAEVLSGIKQLMKTPKQKTEPAEVLSGIKQLLRTPEQKTEPAEVCSGIKQLLRTPKEKTEPAEVLSGIKQLMKTPKQKTEPAEVLSGIKQLLRTPKEKMEPAEVLSGIKQLMKTPKQKTEPVEALSGIKQLLRTPKQKSEPVEVLSGIKQLMRTPQQELQPVTGEIAFEGLLQTPGQIREALKDVAPVNSIKKTRKPKYQPVEDMVGVSRLFKTPKEKVQPIEDVFGISRLVKSPREKGQPVDDFMGLQRLMAEPRQKCSGVEVDYGGLKEMFHVPEEMEVSSVDGTDSEQDPAPPCANSSHKYADQGNISRGEDSQQKVSTSEDQSIHRPTRGRPQKTVHRASAKQRERDLNLKELQSMGEKSTREEMGDIGTSPSVAQNEGRGRRTNRCVQEEILSKPSDEEKVETVSLVELPGATQRPGRGKRKEPKELKYPTDNLESCGKDSSVLLKEPADREQTLQECGTSDILKTADGPAVQTASVSSSIQSENCQRQTALVKPENKSNEGGVEGSDEKLLSPRKRSRRVNKAEITEPLIVPKRGRRARNDPVKQASSEELHGTARKLRRDPSAKATQRGEQTFDKGTETAAAGESENGTKPERKITEKRVKSLRSARKLLTEAKADDCEMALENTQKIQKTKVTSTETDTETPSHIRNEVELSRGDETENAQENTVERSQRLKAESPCGETNKMPVAALNSETNRTRIRRGKAGSLEKKSDEFAKGVHNREPATPQFQSETKMEESSPKDSLGSLCVQDTSQVPKDEKNPAAPSIPAANSLARGRPKRTRNEQGSLQPEQMEILQENQAQKNGAICRRGRGRKVLFDLEEANLKADEGKRSFPVGDKGMSSNDGQQETSENPASQGRRGRRKQADSVPQIAVPASMAKQTSTADHRKDEAVVKEQDSAVEATPPSTEDNLLRRGRRREVTAASQTSRTLSVRTRRGVLEGDDEKMAEREDQNPALGKTTLQGKANASARDKKKKIDLTAEAKSSSLQRKCGSSEADDKEESTNEEQDMPLETESCASGKPLGRGRRRETALASHTTTSLKGKRSLSADHGREEAPKEDQNTPLESFDSSIKENQLRRGRRKEIAPLLEPTSSTQGKWGVSKERGRQNNCREAKRPILENSLYQQKMDHSRGSSKQTITSLPVSSTMLEGLPEDGKNEIPEEQQSALQGATPSAEENPPRGGRKKRTSKSEETSSTSLRENPGLPQRRGQKRVHKGDEDTAPGHNSPQENTRQLRNKRRKVEFVLGPTLNVCSPSAGSEQNDQLAKGKENNAIPRAASCRRRCQLPAEDLASTKPKSGNDENLAPQKGKRKMEEDLGKEVVKAARTTGGTDRRTRSCTRTRK